MPIYGIGAHEHTKDRTVIFPDAQMDCYTPDPNEPGMGTYWYPKCGEGKPSKCN